MSLCRVGGKSDGGIDLQGWWWFPSTENTSQRRRLRVLAQCKAEQKKIGPKYVREMEGVLLRFSAAHGQPLAVPVHGQFPPDTRPQETTHVPTVGLFISASPYSKSTLLRAHSSPLPLALLHLPWAGSRDPEVSSSVDSVEGSGEMAPGSIVFNAALGGSTGLLRGEVESRWEYHATANPEGRPGLWWRCFPSACRTAHPRRPA